MSKWILSTGGTALRLERSVHKDRPRRHRGYLISRTAENAAQAVALRNAAKIEARGDMPSLLRRLAELRNTAKYGNPVGPTVEQLLAKYGSDRAVIDAAGRTSSFWNDFFGL
jgi:hypothetical protein